MYNGKNVVLSRNLRKNMTPWERKLWYNYLRTYRLRFYRQRTIGNYIVDFYCTSVKLAVELDGGGHYETEQTEKDGQRTKYLNENGITVMRIPNNEVWNNFEGVCEAIDLRVKELESEKQRYAEK